MTIDHLRTAIAEQVPRLQKWEVDGLAKKLEASGLMEQEWIPTAQRLPGSLEYVLVHRVSGKDDVGYWMDKAAGWGPKHNRSIVTHWQPLPKAPS